METVLKLVEQADALVEGFRPGVTDRLGIGPDAPRPQPPPRLRPNDRVGPGRSLAQAAGHDIDYIALAGRSVTRPRRQQPTPPINLVGDFGGGGLMMAFGSSCALSSRGAAGRAR